MALHDFIHYEVAARDPGASRRFYEGLFGWKFAAWGEGDDYLTFRTSTCMGGGLFKADDIRPGNSTLIYVHVDEVEPYLAKARELGGGVERGVSEIPGAGLYAILLDPSGNRIGLFKDLNP
jgi:predicted enzyme related to lactoylglutathione lyase